MSINRRLEQKDVGYPHYVILYSSKKAIFNKMEKI